MNQWFVYSFVLTLAILAGTTAYFGTKASVLEDHLARRDEATAAPTPSTTESVSTTPSVTPTTEPSLSASPTPSASATPTATAPGSLAASAHLSNPSETYTVVDGDTLYPVSLKFNMSLERLAEANGLIDPYPLRIGQVLAIPEVNAKQNIFEVRFTTEPAKASLIQETVSSGTDTWRLDPREVGKTENSGVFGLGASDDYRLQSRDDAAGTAVVIATRLVGTVTKNYEIHLTQPATKGSAGVWSITRISPKAA